VEKGRKQPRGFNEYDLSLESGLDPLGYDIEHDGRERLLDIRVFANRPCPGRLKQVIEPVKLTNGDVRVVRERGLDCREVFIGRHLAIHRAVERQDWYVNPREECRRLVLQ
jgi:hypothetical protein